MAHQVEPMDIDGDFDNKENSYHHNNVLPCTEKGYEELDVSELNMKLRYSVTPASSPMSKSYTANCVDHRSFETGDDSQNITVNENLTRSLNSSIKNDNVIKSLKTLPLQSISSEQFNDNNKSTTVLRPLDTTITPDNANVTVTVSGPNDIDDNLSLPSSSSSAPHTPEATTPTKEIPKSDGGSPIMRGLKSVLNMFRSSQSPIPPECDRLGEQEVFSTAQVPANPESTNIVMASTPISAHRKKETSPSKRNSPYKESIVFNDDLEKELQWKDETTILFSQERIPIHKLFFQQTQPSDTKNVEKITNEIQATELDSTVEYMDISYNESTLGNKTITDIHTHGNKTEIMIAGESDSEFVDCETTFTKNESQLFEDKTPVNETLDLNKDMAKNESTSKLKPIILNTTQDILDATLSITPEDIYPEVLGTTKGLHHISSIENPNKLNETKVIDQVGGNTQETAEHENVEKNDQTFGITTQVINTESATLNATQTIENLTTGIGIANTQNAIKVTDNCDVKKAIDFEAHIDRNSEKQAVSQNLDATHIIDKSYDNLNVTNTIEIDAHIGRKSEEHAIPQSLHVTHITENQPEIIDNLDLTRTIDTNAHIDKQIEEKATIPSLDTTHTIETQAKVIDNLDVTKVIQFGPNIDHKLEEQVVTHNLDTTHTIENQPKVVDNHNVTRIVEIDCNMDRTSEELATSQNLDVTHAGQNEYVESQIYLEPASNIDAIQSIEKHTVDDSTSLEHATVQDNKPTKQDIMVVNPIVNLAGNMNITNENEPIDNLTGDNSNIPILENNNLITEHEFAIERVDIIETSKPIEGNIIEILPKYDIPISLDVKPFELPADVPLPDEDDIDKELNVAVDNIVKVPCNLPLDLVENIKTQTNNIESTEEKPSVEKEFNEVQPEVMQTNVANNEENIINDPIVEVPDCKLVKNSDEINTNEIKNKVPTASDNVHKEMLLKVDPLPDNLLIKDKKMPADKANSSKILHDTHIITEPSNNLTLDNVKDERKPELDITLPTDINESVSECKPLPDIINQITTTCQADIGEATESIEIAKQQSPVELAATKDNIGNITSATPTVTEAVTVLENMPQELGDFNVCTNTDIPIEKILTEEIPVIAKNVEPIAILDTVANNMSIDEIVECSENIKNDLGQDINTPASAPSQAQTDNVSPETKLIHTADVTVGNVIIDEEIVASENSSPFVCVMAEPEIKTGNDGVDDPLNTKNRIVCTPPASPPIASKGYNFNFDEYDEPFATKTNIRMSPTFDTPNKCDKSNESERNVKKPTMGRKEMNIRRKTQTERKRPPAQKNKFNSTFNSASDTGRVDKPVEELEVVPNKIVNDLKSEVNTKAETFDKEDKEVQDIIKTANKNIEQKLKEALKVGKEIEGIDKKLIESTIVVEKPSDDSLIEAKTTSSSEQSTYFSAGTSSSDSIKSRNVFNLPEIDDMNFNPFATKSKMRQSPQLTQDVDNPFATRSKMMSSPDISLNDANITMNINEMRPISDDKMETELMEKDSSTNISNTTTSSKATDDIDTTVREVNTEDEDTAEGPFLEVEDLHSDVNMPDLNTENDMMQFHEVPPQVKAENQDDELFIDAEAFEFLLNQNKTTSVVDSGKESLFLKFDPLFAKRMSSDGVLAALTQLQKRQSTPTKLTRLPQKDPISPMAGPSNMNITHNIDVNTSEELNDDLNVTVSKPMMVVPPAVNPITPRNKSVTPTRSNRRSVTFTSPAMAVIDRLLSLSANNSPIYDNTYTHVSREQNEADLALAQLRELLAEKEVHVYNLRTESKELKDRLTTMESQVRVLETESQTRLKKINELNETLVEKSKINKSMAAVVEEYERTIASLIAEIEQDKKRHAEERMKLINERDEQTAHLASMEVSFSDLHSKYEKSKQVIFSCKANEDVYKKSIKEFEENVTKMQKNFDLLKQHATSKLNHANQELEKMNKAHEAEVVKLSAMIKRKELHITSLEETLAQKTKANEELTAICDELINKVG